MRDRDEQLLLDDATANSQDNHFDVIFTKHPCLYCFIPVAVITLDCVEIATDWLFFRDIYTLEKGLVYGPLNPYLLMLVLLICGLGSLIFLFEIVNVVYYVCSGKPWISLETCFVITVWFQELPFTTASFVITMCHNEPVSYFQLIKALLVITSTVLKIVIPLICASLDKKKQTQRKTCWYVSKAFLVVGLCLMLCGSVAIFIFTHVIATHERQFRFRFPEEIWSGQYAYDRYFTNVGIYFHHVKLKNINYQNSEIWIRLAMIDDFYGNDYMHVKIAYQENNNKIEKLMVTGYNETNLIYTECYNHGVDGIEANLFNECTQHFIPKLDKHERLAFKFLFVRPQQTLLLGNIVYNVKYLDKPVCWNITSNETDVFYPTINNKSLGKMGSLLYLKHDTKISNIQRLVHEKVNTKRTPFFLQTTTHSLLRAEDIWITGMYGCNCTGKKGPVRDERIRVEC